MGTVLFNKYIGEKSLQGARFTSTNLTKLLDAATRYNVAYLSQRLRNFAGNRTLMPEIQQELARFGANEEDFVSLVQQAVRILEGEFFSDEALMQVSSHLSGVHHRLVEMLGALAAFQSRLPQNASGVQHLQACVNGLVGELEGKADMLVAQSEQNPFSCKNVRTAFQQIYASYESVIGQQLARLNQELTVAQPAQAARLNSQITDLNALLVSVQASKNNPPCRMCLIPPEFPRMF